VVIRALIFVPNGAPISYVTPIAIPAKDQCLVRQHQVRKRARLADDPAWRLHLERAGGAGYVLSQETSLLEHRPLQSL
jgi:hypothetical protein